MAVDLSKDNITLILDNDGLHAGVDGQTVLIPWAFIAARVMERVEGKGLHKYLPIIRELISASAQEQEETETPAPRALFYGWPRGT